MPAPSRTGPAFRLDSNDLSLLVVVFVWGLNLSAVKFAFAEIEPLAFNCLRFGAAAAILLLLVRLRGGSLAGSRGDHLRMLGLGLLGHVAYQVFFILGIAWTTASHMALIFGTTPVLIALLSAGLGHERVGPRGWSGAALAVFGTYLIISGKGPGEGPSPSVAGDLFAFLATICWACYTVLAKPLLQRRSALEITALTMGWGALFLVPMTLPWALRQPWSGISPFAWSITAYSCLFPLVVAYFLWYRSVRAVGSVRTSVYSNLVPLVGTLVAWVLLGERLYASLGLGAAAIFAGIALTRSRPREERGDAPAMQPEPTSGRS